MYVCMYVCILCSDYIVHTTYTMHNMSYILLKILVNQHFAYPTTLCLCFLYSDKTFLIIGLLQRLSEQGICKQVETDSSSEDEELVKSEAKKKKRKKTVLTAKEEKENSSDNPYAYGNFLEFLEILKPKT